MIPWIGVMCVIVNLQAAQQFSVEDAVRLGLQQAYSVRSAEAAAEKAMFEARAASGVLSPRLTAIGTYSRFDSAPGTISIPGATAPRDSKQVQFALSTLIDIAGLHRSKIQAARLAESAAEKQVEAEELAVKSQVRAAYFGVLRAEALVVVAQDSLRSAREQLRVAEARFQQDVTSRFDVIRLQAETSQAEKASIESENGVRLAKNALNSLLARPIDTPFSTSAVEVPTRRTDSEAAWVRQALESRPEVRAGELIAGSLGRLSNAEKLETAPALTLSVSHLRTIDPPPFSKASSTVGSVQLSWTLFDSGITKSRVAATAQEEIRALVQVERIQQGVSLEVRQALIALENAEKQVEVSNRQVESADEALRLANLRYREGIGLLLDVTTARAAQTSARQGLVHSRIDVLSAFAELQRAVGADDLGALPRSKREVERK